MNFTLDVNVRFPDGGIGSSPGRFQALHVSLDQLKGLLMSGIDSLKTEGAETRAAVQSLVAVLRKQGATISALTQRLDEALAGNLDPAEVAALKSDLDQAQADAAAAVLEFDPPEPLPANPPV